LTPHSKNSTASGGSACRLPFFGWALPPNPPQDFRTADPLVPPKLQFLVPPLVIFINLVVLLKESHRPPS